MVGVLICSWPLSLTGIEMALHVFMPGHDVLAAPVAGDCQLVMLYSQVVYDHGGVPTILCAPGAEQSWLVVIPSVPLPECGWLVNPLNPHA